MQTERQYDQGSAHLDLPPLHDGGVKLLPGAVGVAGVRERHEAKALLERKKKHAGTCIRQDAAIRERKLYIRTVSRSMYGVGC